MMNVYIYTVYKSGMEEEIGYGSQMKSQDEIITKDGTFRARKNQQTKPIKNAVVNIRSGMNNFTRQ